MGATIADGERVVVAWHGCARARHELPRGRPAAGRFHSHVVGHLEDMPATRDRTGR